MVSITSHFLFSITTNLLTGCTDGTSVKLNMLNYERLSGERGGTWLFLGN